MKLNIIIYKEIIKFKNNPTNSCKDKQRYPLASILSFDPLLMTEWLFSQTVYFIQIKIHKNIHGICVYMSISDCQCRKKEVLTSLPHSLHRCCSYLWRLLKHFPIKIQNYVWNYVTLQIIHKVDTINDFIPNHQDGCCVRRSV